jgi:DNA polymerase III subunit gamma/tau
MNQTPDARQGPYRVLARKYRPQHFGDLIGQMPIVTTLTNAFGSGRIAQAYMLTGVRGVGKTTTARILARALNYKRGDVDAPTIDVAEEGEHCRAIMEGRHVDVIEMDAASHTGIDDIRDIIESVQYAPAIARYKVYIVDEVHMLSRNAFNGLLKTLEEPPAHLKFIFATTEIRKVPVTVLSRCQRFDLRRIDADLMVRHLKSIAAAEKVTVADDALALIARAAEGSVRDALSILDQAIAHSGGEVGGEAVRQLLGLADRARVIDLFENVMRGDIGAALDELKAQYDIGAEPAIVMTDLAEFVHFVTRLKYVPSAADEATLSQEERERGRRFADNLSVPVLGRAWQILLKGIEEVRSSERPLAAADMVLVRLTHAADLPTPDELIEKLREKSASPEPVGRNEAPAAGERAANPPAAVQPLRASPMQAKASVEPALEPVPAPEAAAAPVVVLQRFEDLVLLAEDKRDLKLRTLLRKNVRPVSFADTRIEIGLVEGTPVDFISELGAKLMRWTGKRWTIAVTRGADQPTLEEIDNAEAGQRLDEARADPAVDAILKQFPGARIVDVRLRQSEAEETGIAPPDDEIEADDSAG